VPKRCSLAYANCVAAVRENGIFHSGVLAFEGALFVQRRCKTQMLTRGDLASRSRARSVAHTCMTPDVSRRCCTRLHLKRKSRSRLSKKNPPCLAPFFEPRGDGQTPHVRLVALPVSEHFTARVLSFSPRSKFDSDYGCRQTESAAGDQATFPVFPARAQGDLRRARRVPSARSTAGVRGVRRAYTRGHFFSRQAGDLTQRGTPTFSNLEGRVRRSTALLRQTS
jgi:hypothetical protein